MLFHRLFSQKVGLGLRLLVPSKRFVVFNTKSINCDVDFRSGQSLSAGNASASSEAKTAPAGSSAVAFPAGVDYPPLQAINKCDEA